MKYHAWLAKVYAGESSRNGYVRGSEHPGGLQNKDPKNPLYKLKLMDHPKEEAEFHMNILQKFRDPLSRLANEGVRINGRKPCESLNSKRVSSTNPPLSGSKLMHKGLVSTNLWQTIQDPHQLKWQSFVVYIIMFVFSIWYRNVIINDRMTLKQSVICNEKGFRTATSLQKIFLLYVEAFQNKSWKPRISFFNKNQVGSKHSQTFQYLSACYYVDF